MSPPQTLAFIGCGNMGSAILGGLLDATRADSATTPRLSKFIINTKSASSAERLRSQFQSDAARVEILHGQNVTAMQRADIILLACKPFLAAEILRETGTQAAVAGKLVISIMAGMNPADIWQCIFPDPAVASSSEAPVIVRAMPNVAARLRQSLTIIETNPDLSDDSAELLTWMFEQIGAVKHLAPELFDAGGMLAGASMAMFTVPLDGLLDACVVEGIRRPEALEMAAQVLGGMAALLKDGAHPAVLRENISSPRGCTIQSLLTLEREKVRASFADGLLSGTQHLRKDK